MPLFYALDDCHLFGSQPLLEAFGGQAHVAADDDAPGIQELRVGATDAVGDVFVQFGAELATDVVGLEAGERGHGCVPMVFGAYRGGIRLKSARTSPLLQALPCVLQSLPNKSRV